MNKKILFATALSSIFLTSCAFNSSTSKVERIPSQVVVGSHINGATQLATISDVQIAGLPVYGYGETLNSVCKAFGYEETIKGSAVIKDEGKVQSIRLDKYGNIASVVNQNPVITSVICQNRIGEPKEFDIELVNTNLAIEGLPIYGYGDSLDGVCSAFGYEDTIKGSASVFDNDSNVQSVNLDKRGSIIGVVDQRPVITSALCTKSERAQLLDKSKDFQTEVKDPRTDEGETIHSKSIPDGVCKRLGYDYAVKNSVSSSNSLTFGRCYWKWSKTDYGEKYKENVCKSKVDKKIKRVVLDQEGQIESEKNGKKIDTISCVLKGISQ